MLVITMRVFNADMSSPQRQEQSSRQLVDTESRKFNSYRPRRHVSRSVVGQTNNTVIIILPSQG